MRISDDTLDHVLKTCDDMVQPDKGNLYKLNLSSYLGERYARALADDLRDARAALRDVIGWGESHNAQGLIGLAQSGLQSDERKTDAG